MSTTAPLLEFGPFRLDPARRLLWQRQELVSVTPRALEVLHALVEQPEQVVGKRELMERVWPDTFVEEANLSVNVSALRKALGRQADGRPYIETVSRRGYRFLGAVHPVRDAVRSLAVLPFQALGDNAEEDFGLGMADALITRLGHLGQIVVRPTSAIARYAGAGQDPREAGRSLQVDAVLEGRVQRSAGRMRITVQLTAVGDGAAAWSDTFDAAASHIFDVQDSIAERLARALTLELSPRDRKRLTRHPTEDVAAYQAFLRGRHFWNKLTGPWLEKAREAFEEAIAQDSGYALAHAGLADTYTMLALFGALAPGEAWPRARSAAERALAADDGLAEAHVSLAYVRLFQDWAWPEAERGLARALALNPASAAVRQWHALYCGITGRFDEALGEIRRAQELDPLSLTVSTNAGFQFYLANQFEGEIEQHRRTLELEPDYAPGHWALALAFEQKGRHDEAIAEHRKAVELSAGNVLMKANLARSYALAGKRADARRLLRELAELGRSAAVSPYRIATIWVALGDADATFDCLQQACRARDHWMVFLKVDPMLEAVRADRRFARLVAQVGFPADGRPPRRRAARPGRPVRRR